MTISFTDTSEEFVGRRALITGGLRGIGVATEALLGQVPLHRFGEAQEVAEVVVLLVSDRGSWLSGHNYFVNGGQGAE